MSEDAARKKALRQSKRRGGNKRAADSMPTQPGASHAPVEYMTGYVSPLRYNRQHSDSRYFASMITALPPGSSPTEELYAFLADERLVNLLELVKISDDFLDVVTLGETQHSKMLAWCLNPNEGHAQGDAVLKDFLIAAYQAAKKDGESSNAAFFREWTPGRVRTTSFGSCFISMEFGITTPANQKRRLDLLLIDPVNKIVVTVENKAGASLTPQQLNTYHETVKARLQDKPFFSEYLFAYVVVDQGLDYREEDDLEVLKEEWALLTYDWLKPSAERARRHLERNNHAAQLLMAYCEKQTGWQSDNERMVAELAADLAMTYEGVIGKLHEMQQTSPLDWSAGTFDDPEGKLLLFFLQNQQLCRHLLLARGIGYVEVNLRKSLPSLSEEHVYRGRRWLDFATPAMDSLLLDSTKYWPLFLNIFREKADEGSSHYTLRLFWSTENLAASDEDALRIRDALSGKFPDLGKRFKGKVRKIVIAKGLTAKGVVEAATRAAHDVDACVSSARSSLAVRLAAE